MNKITKTTIALILITLAAFVVRVSLSNYPPLLWDEASLGYNAFSILKTGRDEYGQLLPLILKSFGDYKPGIYAYLSIPFVFLFGLNNLSVRLPSIILGSLTPLLVYLLIRQISPKSKTIGLLTALLIAFNPYNIHFSRGAWETNILTFELVLASYFLFKSISTKIQSKYLLLASLIFGLSLYTYQAGKMMALFILFSFFAVNFRSLFQNLKSFILNLFLPLALFALPVAFGLLFSHTGNRLAVVSLFSYPRPTQERQLITSESNSLDYSLFYNQTQFFIRNFASRYFNHFSPRFLAFEGDWQNPRHSAVYIGVILYPSLVFLIIGLFASFSHKSYLIHRKSNLFFILWLLLAPIPSALTRDSVQAVRAMSFSVPLMYFAAAGIFFSFSYLKSYFINHKSRLIFLSFFSFTLVIIYSLSFIYYSDLYYNHTVARSPMDYLYGYRQATEFLINNQNKYQHVYMSDFYGQPYIYYLFYSQFDPNTYQRQAHLTENAQGDTGKVEKIASVNFSSIPYQLAFTQPSTLVIYSQDEIWRQGIDKLPEFKNFIPLSPIGQISTFYAYQNP